ncbi:type IV secretory system conjugative DNA transfer family protein [Flavobacterium sp. TR2]|uniref:type IV secretory system conjugative DNA transfer family protein n=1 Tax=Flavobacterium sp. TR2 TaxID=2977321 RepID=UPI0021B0EFC8|nr:type IV secretory system conjugative DNA transfer family protein [Flavobacterium sp. TR2]UWY29366.1 type IV secretory system conjugative DNA transfer family protein [Flavobacterium sp. TR2]
MKEIKHEHAKTEKGPITLVKLVLIVLLVLFMLLFFKPLWQGYKTMLHIVWKGIISPKSIRFFLEALFCLFLINIPFIIIAFLLYKKVKRKLIRYKILSPSKGKPLKRKSFNPSALELELNGEVEIKNPYAGVFISGGAGSGKSKSTVEPIIYDAGRKNFTGVVYDFKFPELAKYVETAFQNSKVERKYVNFTNMNITNRVNPIHPELMKNDSYAREFAYSILANLNPSMISKPDFWSDNSLSLLASVFWYLRNEHPKYCTLPHAISLILQPDLEALLNLLQRNSKCVDMIATILTAHSQGAQNQLSGVISSLQVALSKINTAEIYFVTSESDFSLNLNDPDKPIILVVGNDPTLSETYSPVIGLILTSISKQINQQSKEKSLFLIDEFPTVFIPKVEQLPATGRSNKVATILACQDIAQMVDKYGKDRADTILANLGTQFYGRTTNPETAKRVSSLFGKEDKLIESTNRSKSTNMFGLDPKNTSGSSYSYQERDLVKVQDVAQLETGSFYTVLSEGNPRQGKVSIPLNLSFVKTELPQKRVISEEQIENVFDRIKMEAREILSGYKEDYS